MTKTQTQPNAMISAVGRTPLVDLGFLHDAPAGTSIHAKLETANPTGSLKDRSVARMMIEGIAAGHLGGGRRLLDSSSGNAGIAYAAFGAVLGVPVTLVVPGNASRERLDRIRAHGAELILTDPIEGYDFAIEEAKRLARERADLYWYANQYGNDNNWRAHHDGTGEEIVRQFINETGEVPDAFVGGVGTGGSLTGIARRLYRANRQLHVTAVIPETFPGIEGLKPLGSPGDIVPAILDETLIQERVAVSSEDAAATARELAAAGYFVGPSSGAYVYVALQLASTGHYRRIVTLLNDTGERYLTTGMWSG